jgi:hypothetical protein
MAKAGGEVKTGEEEEEVDDHGWHHKMVAKSSGGDSIGIESCSEPRLRHKEPGRRETRISSVPAEPGCRVVFGSHEPGSLAGQSRKHDSLHPTSAKPC